MTSFYSNEQGFVADLSVLKQSRETCHGHSNQFHCQMLILYYKCYLQVLLRFFPKSFCSLLYGHIKRHLLNLYIIVFFPSHFVLYLRHVALLQDVDCLLDVVDDPLDDDVRVVDLDGVHDRLVDVHGQLEKRVKFVLLTCFTINVNTNKRLNN